jgi:hypothetical protein
MPKKSILDGAQDFDRYMTAAQKDPSRTMALVAQGMDRVIESQDAMNTKIDEHCSTVYTRAHPCPPIIQPPTKQNPMPSHDYGMEGKTDDEVEEIEAKANGEVKVIEAKSKMYQSLCKAIVPAITAGLSSLFTFILTFYGLKGALP